ncbi:MAG: 4Fe-4S binding protein, partial [Actinobacteria bacterium]|nr:4Fe-4S binding protein [Actinomycetota bacterium]
FGCTTKASTAEEAAAAEPAEPVAATPSGTLLTLAEMNEMRKQIVDSKEDYTCADGTVIPAVYVKVRSLLDTIGNGVGSEVTDASFGEVMYLFSEEDAQAYLEMPRGKYFTATDFAVDAGHDEAECLAICEDMAARGLLMRSRRGGVAYFHLLAEAHGIWEYNMYQYNAEYVTLHSQQWGTDIIAQLYNADTCFYYAIPVNKEVIAEEEILPYDDYEKIIGRNSVIAVSPCQCRLSHQAVGIADPGNHPLETCITTGEEAEFYIENGIGRQITQEEALTILRRSVEVGMVLQSCHTKDTEVICSCHGDCCDILGSYVALGEGMADLNCLTNLSHYTLEHDKEACIKCGTCQPRCPLFAISIGEEGYPVVASQCLRCGQCATVCPVGARKLVVKEDIYELPQTLLDDYNLKAEYRLRNGMIH